MSGSDAVRAERLSLAEAGLLERQHLQEWVNAHPDILGEEVMIVTDEFDRWATAIGAPTWERLDVLGLDRTGRLVVAELKRHHASHNALTQALNYAAMASRFNLDLLAEAHARHCGSVATPEEAVDEPRAWASSLSDESLAPPRIVLVAEDYGPVLTNTTMFLIESGVDLRLIRIGPYRPADGALALTTSQVLPVPQAEDFMVRPRSAASTQGAIRIERAVLQAHHAYVRGDNSWQRRARLHQSLWRHARDLPAGQHNGWPLGPRLDPVVAEPPTLANYLSPEAQRQVLNAVESSTTSGALLARPRLWVDLLSSQPLCFNCSARSPKTSTLPRRHFR